MPRRNSTNWNIADPITAARLNDFNTEIDNILTHGSDKGRIVTAASEVALKVDIASFSYVVGSSKGIYVGVTDLLVTDDAVNYIEIDPSGIIQINTSTWDSTNSRIGKVTTVSGIITEIEDWRPDIVGGELGGGLSVMIVRQVMANGVNGGVPSLRNWVTRTLNTEDYNTIIGASLSANQVTLPIGVYKVSFSVVHHDTDQSQAKLRNVTDLTDTLIGESVTSDASDPTSINSIGVGTFSIAAEKVFDIQSRTDSGTTSSNGFGLASVTDTGTNEVYINLEITKIG